MDDQTTTPELVHYEVTDQVARLTLDSPRNRNALSRDLVAGLLDRLDRAEADPAVVAVVVQAAGSVFCSGADLEEATTEGMAAGTRRILELQRRIVASPKPVVTRIGGAVRAGGIGIVAASDIAVASTEATFAFTEVRLALAPAVVSVTVLPRLTSRAAARAFLTGDTFDGTTAADIGLVTTAVPEGRLDAEVDAVLRSLREGHPQGLAEAKRLANAELLARIDRDGQPMAALSERLFGSQPARTAMQQFLDRRGR